MSGSGVWLGFFLVSCALAADMSSVLQGDDPALRQKNTCAMTQVLQAMNELLTSLSAEVRDIRRQVQTSCRGHGDARGGGRRPPNPQRKPEVKKKNEEDDIFETFGKDPEEEKEATESPGSDYEDYDYRGGDGGEDSPANDLINDLSSWWDSIVPFAKPTEGTTTTEAPTPAPIPDYYYGHGDIDDSRRDEVERHGTSFPTDDGTGYPTDDGTGYPPDDGTGYPTDDGTGYPTDDGTGFPTDYDTSFPPDDTSFPTPDFAHFYPPTTSQPPIYYPLPPEPTTCPTPFHNQAGGCYLVFHDQRDWRSWGEAHAFCQNYGGTLAAPHRLRELQTFLSRYYSDAFWVGAKFDVPSRRWKWLNGREVERGTWKQGQPSRNQNMKCIFLDKWSGYRATNFFCGEKYPFICDYRQPENQ
ncbi:uncharacterized protein [Macrobrachium rosenbergii]|uniref:uncharacterized protein n=1 Tax=Macrobrachium rosenbergii TaxID=79674 RepID=UPI0034D520BC